MPAPQNGDELVIVHTNDLHTHFAGNDKVANACNREENCQGGYGQIANLMAEKKAANQNVLVIDAGDRLQGSLIYSIKKWPAVVEVEKFMDFDIATLGNHEFDEGCEELAKYLNASKFPVVAANLAPGAACPLSKANIVPYKIYDFGSFTVGVIGLANSSVFVGAKACNSTVFKDPKASAQKAIDELKAKGINLIIITSHLGLPEDLLLGGTLKGADIIVGGHSHKYIGPGSEIGPYPIVVTSAEDKPVLIVTTNGLARFLGELKVKLSSEGKMLSWSGNPIHLGPAGGNKNITEVVNKDYEQIKNLLNQSVGVNEVVYPDGMEACRHGVCLTAALMAQVMLDYSRPLGANIALINGGTTRNGIPSGKVTLGDLLSAMPFGDLVVLKELTGAQLMQVLEHGVTGKDGVGPRMLHTAGLKYSYKVGDVSGPRLVSAELVLPDGSTKPINPKEKYIVAVNAFCAEGGDGQVILAQSKTIADTGVLVLDLMVELFKKESPLTKKPEDGIIQISN